MTGELDAALDLIAEVPDFPEPGVRYKDVTPMLADPKGLHVVTDALAETLPADVELIAGVEARGFVFAASVAYRRGVGMLPLRKSGKLPRVSAGVKYDLEYGTAQLELPAETVRPGQRIAVIDDVLATGGTLGAACDLVEKSGAEVAAISVVLELAVLSGRAALPGRPVHVLRTA